MRLGSLLAVGLLATVSGCQMCDNCSDYAPPASFTAPGEAYAGSMLPAGPPVVPQVVPPGARQSAPGESPTHPRPAGTVRWEIPMASRR